MSTNESIRMGCLAVYGTFYAVAILFALASAGGATGGMAFVWPILLGFPWTLILGLLILVPQVPTPITCLVLLVVPPAINAFLILRTRGIVFAPRESPNETRMGPRDTDPDTG